MRRTLSGRLAFWGALVAAVCFARMAQASDEAIAPDKAQAAIARSIALVEKSAAVYRKERQCFSCHHQALPVFMLSQAAERGFSVDRENLRQQVEHTAAHLRRGLEDYRKGSGQGGRFDTAGWALWTLEVGEHPADEVTQAVAEYLLAANSNKSHWTAASNRPPTEASPFTTTYVALRGLSAFGTEEQQPRIAARREAALAWLAGEPGKDTEDRVFRLRSLDYLNADRELIEAAAYELRSRQREDGGWSQTAELASDAYATATAMTALNEAGTLPATDTAYRRGAALLLKIQEADGSWRVATRSKPIQKYFESGFPHGADQFISMAATSWATLALLSVPEVEGERHGKEKPGGTDGDPSAASARPVVETSRP